MCSASNPNHHNWDLAPLDVIGFRSSNLTQLVMKSLLHQSTCFLRSSACLDHRSVGMYNVDWLFYVSVSVSLRFLLLFLFSPRRRRSPELHWDSGHVTQSQLEWAQWEEWRSHRYIFTSFPAERKLWNPLHKWKWSEFNQDKLYTLCDIIPIYR